MTFEMPPPGNSIDEVVNLLQDINKGVEGVQYAPHMDKYLVQISDTLPFVRTDFANWTFTSVLGTDSITAQVEMTTTCFYAAYAQGNPEYNRWKYSPLSVAFSKTYTDPDTYAPGASSESRKVIRYDPHVEILDPLGGASGFTVLGPDIQNYPMSSEFNYWMFSLAFTISMEIRNC